VFGFCNEKSIIEAVQSSDNYMYYFLRIYVKLLRKIEKHGTLRKISSKKRIINSLIV
jgi:hypothetical protein